MYEKMAGQSSCFFQIMVSLLDPWSMIMNSYKKSAMLLILFNNNHKSYWYWNRLILQNVGLKLKSVSGKVSGEIPFPCFLACHLFLSGFGVRIWGLQVKIGSESDEFGNSTSIVRLLNKDMLLRSSLTDDPLSVVVLAGCALHSAFLRT